MCECSPVGRAERRERAARVRGGDVERVIDASESEAGSCPPTLRIASRARGRDAIPDPQGSTHDGRSFTFMSRSHTPRGMRHPHPLVGLVSVIVAATTLAIACHNDDATSGAEVGASTEGEGDGDGDGEPL